MLTFFQRLQRLNKGLVLVLFAALLLYQFPSAQAEYWNPIKSFKQLTGIGQEINPEPEQEAKATPTKKTSAHTKATPMSPVAMPAIQTLPAQVAPPKSELPKPVDTVSATTGAVIETSRGNIIIEFFPTEAPKTVENFVTLAKSQFYNTPTMKFHRVVPGFVVQTGDPSGTGYGGSSKTIPLEVANKLSHKEKGMVAMARGPAPDSATSQFYITLAPQANLDGKYAVFGRVIQGLDVLDQIQKNDRVYGVRLMDISNVPRDSRQSKGNAFKRLFEKSS